jgi:hypothetical protein
MAIVTSKIPKKIDRLEITAKKSSGLNMLAFKRNFVARN